MSEERAEDAGPEADRGVDAPRSPEAMGGLAKGLTIIEAFSEEAPGLTVSEAAAASRSSRSAARRCLLTLESLGFVTHDGKRFWPTPRMLRLGSAYTGAATLPRLAQPHLEAARDELVESVSLAVLEEDCSVIVARAEAPQIVMTGVRLGVRMPAHATATGRVLLSALPSEELERALKRARPEARTFSTIVSRPALRERIAEAREEKMACIDEEMQLGIRSLAVPVCVGRDDTQVAAMSVSALCARVSLDQLLGEFRQVLRRHADALGNQL